jgi:hypothetical protein
MKINIKNSEGIVLNWAVCKAEGLLENESLLDNIAILKANNYLTDWNCCGKIILKEFICLEDRKKMGGWLAYLRDQETGESKIITFGKTPQIAAMRCYATYKLGEEIDVPDEILSTINKIKIKNL